MQNQIIAVTEQMETAGAIIWWRLSGTTAISALTTSWTGVGLDEKRLPNHPTAAAALRRTMAEEKSPSLLARPLKDGGWALVREQGAGRDLDYEVELKVWVDAEGAGTLIFDTLGHPREEAIRDMWAAQRGVWSTEDIGAWLVRQAFHHQAVSLRDTGGFYFIPRHELHSWRNNVAALVAKASGHTFFEIPALRSEEALAAVLDALGQEATGAAQVLEQELAEAELGPRALATRREQCATLLTKLKAYEESMGLQLGTLCERVESLQAQVAAAALAAMGAEVVTP